MPREWTLLERLRREQGPSSRTAVENTSHLIRSIENNLRRIMNAREGHAPAQLDYGVPAPSEIVYDYPSGVTRMQEKIRSCIEKYEPRLADVDVIHVENDEKTLFALRFQVQGRLATSKSKSWVNYLVHMDPSGRIKISH